MLRTAIIGAGKIMDSHLRAIGQLDRLKAVAVADVQVEKAQEAGRGILTNLGAHSIDKIQWLLDSPIRKVKAHLSYHVGRGESRAAGRCSWRQCRTGRGLPVLGNGYRNRDFQYNDEVILCPTFDLQL